MYFMLLISGLFSKSCVIHEICSSFYEALFPTQMCFHSNNSMHYSYIYLFYLEEQYNNILESNKIINIKT